MAALAPSGIEIETLAPALGQTAELAQEFVPRHVAWIAVDIAGVKARMSEVAERGP